MSDFEDTFLEKSTEDSKGYTHVYCNPMYFGRIETENISSVLTAYVESLSYSDGNLHFAEKMTASPPVLALLELKFRGEHLGMGEPFPDNSIHKIIFCYQQAIRETLIVGTAKKELTCCYLESDMYDDEESKYSCMNIRLQFPYCKVDIKFQNEILRPRVIELLHKNNPWSRAEMQPVGSWEDIIKKDFLSKPFLYYGSVREEEQPLELQDIFDEISEDVLNDECKEVKIRTFSVEDTFQLKYNRYIQKDILKEREFFGKSPEELLPLFLSLNYWDKLVHKKTAVVNDYLEQTEENKIDEYDEQYQAFQRAKTLSKMLKKDRFSNEIYWDDIGVCFYRTTEGGDDGFESWMDISRKNGSELSKNVDTCRYIYEKFEYSAKKYDWQTLATYALEDNKKKYERWHEDWVKDAIIDIFEDKTPADTKVGKAIYRTYFREFVCYNPKKGKWKQFRSGRWVETANGVSLSKKIFRDFVRIIAKYRKKLTDDLALTNDQNRRRDGEQVLKRIGMLMDRLGNLTYIDKYMKVCKILFYNENFSRWKDSNPNLTGCKNGVIEVMENICLFRKGKPQDYITMSTHVNYPRHYTWETPEVKKAMRWMKQMYIDPELIKYRCKMMASGLRAGNNDKIFPIHSGEGGNNSKSMELKWYTSSWGDYCIQFDESVIFSKTGAGGGGPSPEIARAANTRWAFINEPDRDAKISDGKVKKFTGGDAFFARMLNENGGDIIATFVMAMICNSIPSFVNAGDAIKERARVIPYDSRWSKRAPDDEDEQYRQRCFKLDRFFDKSIPAMAPAHLWIATQYWKEYVEEGLLEPECIKEATKTYWEASDPYYQFENECIEKMTDSNGDADLDYVLTIDQAYGTFKRWYRTNFPGKNSDIPARDILRTELNARWGKAPLGRWAGVTIRETVAHVR